MAYVLRFINSLKTKRKNQRKCTSYLIDVEIKAAKGLFFKKTSLELKHFVKQNQYQNISNERNGMQMYTERILLTSRVNIVGELSKAMLDVKAATYYVSIMGKHSIQCTALFLNPLKT